MWIPSGSKKSSKKYVDHIYKSCTKYPVWDPASDHVRVGDVGTIEEDTGQFLFRGNIYTDDALKARMAEYPPKQSVSSSGVISVTSTNAKSVRVSPGVDVGAQVAAVKFKCAWQFVNGSGAVLAVHNPRETCLPRDFDVDIVTEHEPLRGLYLVTSVTTCPAYALYLSSQQDSGISITLLAHGPIPATALTGGISTSVSWASQYGGGFYRAENEGVEPFTVLYVLKKCKRRQKFEWLRDGMGPEEYEGADQLEDARPPWGNLDEDGEEDEICDE